MARRNAVHTLTSCALVLCLTASLLAQQEQSPPRAMLERAIADFLAGRVEASVQGFDALAKASPAVAPELWQRGIALYYVGRYRDCRAQFELHRTVNPNDVENAAWHFLCVARADSAERAKAALLPVGSDPRAPMGQVYDMFRGTLTPDAVLRVAGSDRSAQFYAQLYVGLYYEALGNRAKALEHLTIAAGDQYARAGGYMHAVAKIHVARGSR